MVEGAPGIDKLRVPCCVNSGTVPHTVITGELTSSSPQTLRERSAVSHRHKWPIFLVRMTLTCHVSREWKWSVWWFWWVPFHHRKSLGFTVITGKLLPETHCSSRPLATADLRFIFQKSIIINTLKLLASILKNSLKTCYLTHVRLQSPIVFGVTRMPIIIS